MESYLEMELKDLLVFDLLDDHSYICIYLLLYMHSKIIFQLYLVLLKELNNINLFQSRRVLFVKKFLKQSLLLQL